MKKQLEEFFGCVVNIKEYKEALALPIYMVMRHIRIVELYGISFALVDITKETDLSASAMKKQRKMYEEAMRCPVAYEVSVNSLSARNAMVKNGIAFIALPGNVFLPFLGIVLQDIYKKQSVRADRMMPATQMVFLKLLYMDDNVSALKSEIASQLNLTKTSITRATAQLKEMDLITEKKSGTGIRIMRNCARKEYYDRAKKYLINPVQKVVIVKPEEAVVVGFEAGEAALSSVTELNLPRVEERAIYKGAELVDQLETVDVRFEDQSRCVKLQLWKYDPAYFAKNRVVDSVSLACTFLGNEDERIEMCLEELLEEI